MYVVVAAPAQSKQLASAGLRGRGMGRGMGRVMGRGMGVASFGAARRALSTGCGTMHASSVGECLKCATA